MLEAQGLSRVDTATDAGRTLTDQPVRSPLERLMATPSPLDRLAPPPSYTVKSGDTLTAIAARFKTDVATLARINGIPDPDKIGVGQSIRLPASQSSRHTVHTGETLSGIAAAHGTDAATLARINGIRNPDLIRPGQDLQLREPAGAPRPQAPKPTAAPAPTPAPAPQTQAPTGTHRLGQLSERYETGGRGPGTVSSGKNDPGGVSYGSYQLSTNAGTLQSFLRSEGKQWAGELKGTPGSATFTQNWKAVAARDPQGFKAAQHSFIERTHYKPAVDDVKAATGLDLNSRHDAVRDATWSTSVQHGGAAKILTAAVRKTDAQHQRGSADYDKALVQNIYAERKSYVLGLANSGKYSAGEAAQLREVANTRYPAELRDATAMFNRPASSAPAPAATNGAAPAANGTARNAAQFADIINRSGDATAKADLAAGRKVLVAVRTDSSTGANGGQGEYNDTMALVWKDGAGRYHAQSFQGNTEPAGKYAARGYGNDVNGDGRKELGRLVEGNYRYELQGGTFAGNRFFRATENQTALRDSNHDGRFTGADTIDRTGAGRSMLIHQGGNSTTGSAGCQTLRPSDFNALLGALGGQSRFSYVLVNANR